MHIFPLRHIHPAEQGLPFMLHIFCTQIKTQTIAGFGLEILCPLGQTEHIPFGIDQVETLPAGNEIFRIGFRLLSLMVPGAFPQIPGGKDIVGIPHFSGKRGVFQQIGLFVCAPDKPSPVMDMVKGIFMSRSPRQRELKPPSDLWDQGTIFNMVENSHSQGQGSWGD